MESNKLTVRYHEIPVKMLEALKSQLNHSKLTPVDDLPEGPVFNWEKRIHIPGKYRAPVLPDLRTGGGFTLICWIDFTQITSGFEGRKMLVNGMSCVSGSLDEEDAEDINKGFTIEVVDNTIRLFVTDGFKTEFDYKVLDVDQRDQTKIEEFYGIRKC